jgi:hypothetical protein
MRIVDEQGVLAAGFQGSMTNLDLLFDTLPIHYTMVLSTSRALN